MPLAGEIYDGVVKRIQPFGAFVEILPGKEGLVHVSDMSEAYVKDPADLMKIGDKAQVRVKGIDDLGRLNLSMVLDPSFDTRKEERRKDHPRMERAPQERRFERQGNYGRRDFDTAKRDFDPTRRGFDPAQRGFERRGRAPSGPLRRSFSEASRQGGPHFPTSRFIDENKKKY